MTSCFVGCRVVKNGTGCVNRFKKDLSGALGKKTSSYNVESK